MRTLCLALISNLLIASALASNALTAQITDPVRDQPGKNDPPNVVLILADDLGFSDIASYGSEINTPSLSALAELGVSFTNYHTAANCAPARAILAPKSIEVSSTSCKGPTGKPSMRAALSTIAGATPSATKRMPSLI